MLSALVAKLYPVTTNFQMELNKTQQPNKKKTVETCALVCVLWNH